MEFSLFSPYFHEIITFAKNSVLGLKLPYFVASRADSQLPFLLKMLIYIEGKKKAV